MSPDIPDFEDTPVFIEPGYAHFGRDEAQQMIGRWVRARVSFPGVPKGTMGKVVQVGAITDSRGQVMYDVGLLWDVVWPGMVSEAPIPAGEASDNMPCVSPMIDWFNKGEYMRYLVEVDQP